MPVAKLKEFLDKQGVKYVTIHHSPAFTAQEVAASAHVSGREMAKVVMVKLDGQMAMVVVAANHRIDMDALAHALDVHHVELASESDFRGLFPQCDLGAMPPFGNLYQMEVFVEESLADEETIAFNAGSHTEVIKMSFGDFEHLVKPRFFASGRDA